jgi:hypothetical protein
VASLLAKADKQKSPVVRPGFFRGGVGTATYFEMRSFDSLVLIVENVASTWLDEVR